MNIWAVIAVCACILIAFFCCFRSFSGSLTELDAAHDAAQVRLSQMRAENAELEAQMETVGTDAFIENQARTMYGYMMPDEIRFVIDNPDALGYEEIPSP